MSGRPHTTPYDALLQVEDARELAFHVRDDWVKDFGWHNEPEGGPKHEALLQAIASLESAHHFLQEAGQSLSLESLAKAAELKVANLPMDAVFIEPLGAFYIVRDGVLLYRGASQSGEPMDDWGEVEFDRIDREIAFEVAAYFPAFRAQAVACNGGNNA